ncbi:MAG: type II 3-dehydroquinate dehydratase [Taibaiella sp.]|nr:type II 3-dehydroquinate dehydratase [Taibaiella sp.]
MRIAIINGPNLNLLGTREPEVYGNENFRDFLATLDARFPSVEIAYHQSNIEGELINFLHACIDSVDGVVLNAGGYTHTSIAIADAVAAIRIPVIEVHISNVLAREDYRKTSFIAAKCKGSISGLGLDGYALAIQYFQSYSLP